MDHDALLRFVQGHFTDGIALVVGSGLSAAEGMPGMVELAAHLGANAGSVPADEIESWKRIDARLKAGDGLEAALQANPVSDRLQLWIAKQTCDLLLPKERAIMTSVLRGQSVLRLTVLLNKMLRTTSALQVLTTNYDRLVELACEMSGLHVDTTALGHYAGKFDHSRSMMASCRGVVARAKSVVLDYFPRAVVLKPHGSFDWYRCGANVLRCSADLDHDRLIITPGTGKYRAGYEMPFDKHRDMANGFIDKASRFLVVGYGFNDDHLETHLQQRILGGAPTLVLSRTAGARTVHLAKTSPACVVLSKRKAGPGYSLLTRGAAFEHADLNLWDLGALATEALG